MLLNMHQQLCNIQSLDLSLITLLIGLAFLTACTAIMFHHFLKPGMIFNWYAIFLESFESKYKRCKRIDKILWWKIMTSNRLSIISLQIMWVDFKLQIFMILSYLSKPLGLCPYCNGTWIGIIVYIYYFKLNLPIILFLGVNWFFIHLIYNLYTYVRPGKRN